MDDEFIERLVYEVFRVFAALGEVLPGKHSCLSQVGESSALKTTRTGDAC